MLKKYKLSIRGNKYKSYIESSLFRSNDIKSINFKLKLKINKIDILY